MKRCPRLAAKYDSEATHRIVSSSRRYVAVGTESPTPVPIATQAARHAGHFGSSARVVPRQHPAGDIKTTPGERRPVRASSALTAGAARSHFAATTSAHERRSLEPPSPNRDRNPRTWTAGSVSSNRRSRARGICRDANPVGQVAVRTGLVAALGRDV